MSKKNFKSGIDFLIQDTKNNIEEEKIADKEKNRHQKIKGTYYFETGLLNDAKSVAYYARIPIGEVLNQALKLYLKSYGELDKARDFYNQKA